MAERPPAHPYEPERKPNGSAPAKSWPEWSWIDLTRPIEPPSWLIKGILPQTGVGVIGGQSGAGKSFQAIHQAVCLLPGARQKFYIDKYRIKRTGGVLFFVLEGMHAFPLRFRTAYANMIGDQTKCGDLGPPPVGHVYFNLNLYEEGPDAMLSMVNRGAEQMRRDFGVDPVAIYIDTMGLAARYENENQSAQVQEVYACLTRASNETGALVIGVDHYGKDQEKGLRGTSAKRDGPETILACLIDRTPDGVPHNHRMVLHKIRDGVEGRIIPYRLEGVTLGVDEDGDTVSTNIVRWEPDRVTEKATSSRTKTTKLLDAAIREVGGLPADVEALKKAFYRFHGGNVHACNTAWNRAVRDLNLEVTGNRIAEQSGLPF